MSKIGKIPITVPNGTTLTTQNNQVKVVGPKGTLQYVMPAGIRVEIADGKLSVLADNVNDRVVKAKYGLTRATLANMVKGVNTDFVKKLELSGVGYRAQMQGNTLVLALGYSHPVKFVPEQGITISVAENIITIKGINKTLVGQTAAKIRDIRPPEPYKEKGIKYLGEKIRRKAGKAAKAAGTK